jgi:hypothetical protein
MPAEPEIDASNLPVGCAVLKMGRLNAQRLRMLGLSGTGWPSDPPT